MRIASWIELSQSAYAANIAVFRKLAGSGRVGVVLKGNAYGHGLEPTLSIAHALVDVLYVITPGEAAAIRAWEAANSQPQREVVVLGAISAEHCVELARLNVSAVAADRGFEAAVKTGVAVHVHLDTGLSREGFTLDQLRAGEADFLRGANVRGVMSHFANTEDVTEQEYARQQLANFETGLALLEERIGLKNPQRHFAASAAALVLPPSRLDVVRIGIAQYGLWPSAETRLSARVVLGDVPTLEPVLTWKAPSQIVKWLKAGSYVGYGCTYRCSADTRVAVLPVGYWDGYPRLASGKAHVLVNGQRCPVLGRVMMNHLIVDVTHAVKDESPLTATLLGRDGDETVSAETLSSWAQTIHYETVTRFGAHLERVITK